MIDFQNILVGAMPPVMGRLLQAGGRGDVEFGQRVEVETPVR
jgi:hypothetical protein